MKTRPRTSSQIRVIGSSKRQAQDRNGTRYSTRKGRKYVNRLVVSGGRGICPDNATRETLESIPAQLVRRDRGR